MLPERLPRVRGIPESKTPGCNGGRSLVEHHPEYVRRRLPGIRPRRNRVDGASGNLCCRYYL